MANKGKRFVVKEEQGSFFGSIQVLVDTTTGVNYLVIYDGTGPSGIIASATAVSNEAASTPSSQSRSTSISAHRH